MALIRFIITFAMCSALATYFTSACADNKSVRRSLTSLPRSLTQNPRTIQRKTSQIPPLTTNLASEKLAQTSSTVGIQVKAAASSEMQSTTQQQHLGNLRHAVPTESRSGLEKLDVASRAVATTGNTMTANQEQDLSSNKKVSALKGSVPQPDTMGGRNSEVSVTAPLNPTVNVEPLVSMEAIPSKPEEEKSLSTHEDEQDAIVSVNEEMAQDEKEDAQTLLKRLRQSEPLPGQVKVDELLKAHRGDRDVDDVSNKDAEKERFFRLMYGRSKPSKFVEY